MGSDERFVTRLYDAVGEIDWQDVDLFHKYRDYRVPAPGHGARRFFDEPYERPCRVLNRQFAGFWRVIWPVFQQQIQLELLSAGAN